MAICNVLAAVAIAWTQLGPMWIQWDATPVRHSAAVQSAQRLKRPSQYKHMYMQARPQLQRRLALAPQLQLEPSVLVPAAYPNAIERRTGKAGKTGASEALRKLELLVGSTQGGLQTQYKAVMDRHMAGQPKEERCSFTGHSQA